MNLLHELLQTLRVHRTPLLVTDTNLLQIEWGWMTHIGTELTPLGGDRTISKLDKVECIVDIALEILDSYMCIRILIIVLILASQTYRENWQWLCTNLLRKEEVLVEAQAQRLIVVREKAMWEGISPAVLVQRTVLRSTHRVLPLITGIEVGSLYDTSARETEDAWLQVGEILYEIGTETIPVVFWEERDVVEIYALGTFLQIYAHQTLGIGLRRCQCSCKLLPLVVGDVDDLLGNDIIL